MTPGQEGGGDGGDGEGGGDVGGGASGGGGGGQSIVSYSSRLVRLVTITGAVSAVISGGLAS